MRVAVVGAGIIGVTTAYELAASGHEVTVFERHSSVAEEASFANAGLVAPGYVTPWAAPGMPAKVLGQIARRHAAVRVHADLDLGWAWRWWRACRAATWQANRLRMQRLAFYSRERLLELTRSLRLDYERRQGFLVLLRTPKELALAEPGLATLTVLGTRFAVVDADACRTIEPGLAEATALHAGVHLPDEEVGNCRQFALLLRREAERLGARFRFETVVQQLRPGPRPRLVHCHVPRPPRVANDRATHPSAPDGPDTQPYDFEPELEETDAVVVCAALGAPALLRPLGLRLPLRPVYGYSITLPLRPEDQTLQQGPRAALMDERYKVAISRLGARVRVAGSAEIGGSRERVHEQAVATLYKVLADWFPGAALLGQAQHWKGARPMLPDGPPVLGSSGLEGIWLNLGHGSSGWALSCGSARLLADAIGGRAAEIDTEGLGLARLRRRAGA
jgi:D-amino-acid dehydrogenase